MIKLQNISKYYRVTKREKSGMSAALKSFIKREYQDVHAVEHVNLSVHTGEIRALIGPNGAGKSTVLKMISGILYPSCGDIQVMNYTPWKQREQLVRKIGVVFGQKSQLWWDLPAVDTYHLNKIIYDIPENIYQKNLEYFVEHLNLQKVISKPIRQLSLGERMKCEFVCALLHEPPLVILDEPTIGLDIFSKEEIRLFIKQMNRDKNTTFLITTHDLMDVEELCENITVINQGTVTFDDTMENLKGYYAHRKILQIQFDSPLSKEDLKQYHLLAFDAYSAKIEIDMRQLALKDAMMEIYNRFPVSDITVKNIPIEELIRDIYGEKSENYATEKHTGF